MNDVAQTAELLTQSSRCGLRAIDALRLRDAGYVLMARGKTHKLALTACARKLIIYANTVVERGTPWVKSPQST
jgi:hypothetical protein